MPGEHATLSPSSAERWISCPASVRMVAEYAPEKDDDGSVYAMEGTIAHALAEIEASHTFGLTTRRKYLADRRTWQKDFDAQGYPEDTLADMESHVAKYVAYLAGRLKEIPNSRIMLEQRLNSGVPGSWGTSDAVIFSPEVVEIVDFKYGAGVQVYARRNPQLRLYGLGALDRYGDLLGDTETVTCTVFQPRVLDGWVDSETLPADELRAWRTQVAIPAAEETTQPDARFGPSEDACRWCPVKNICRVRMETACQEDFSKPAEVLSAEELAEVLHRVPMIKTWVADVQAHALAQAYEKGEQLPGWKVVMSGGKRSIVDAPKALELLQAKGYTLEQVAIVDPKPRTLGALEKLVGKKVLPEVLGPTLRKGDGKPSLVPESDPREPITADSGAAADFGPPAAEDLL